VELDRIDLQILNLLQEDATIPLRRLAEQVHASAATSQRYEVAGEYDFMLVVTATSMEDFQAFTRRVFTSTNNVNNYKSLLAMGCSKFETKVPL
jgi:Lrp/AsnC family leucine-responsive transcriptional regulator